MTRVSSSRSTKRASQKYGVPDYWSHRYIKPIPQTRQGPKQAEQKYRTLTMRNTTGKLIDLIMAKKLAQGLQRRNVLPPNQGGYRAQKATWKNSVRSAYDVYEGFQKKEQTRDLAGARLCESHSGNNKLRPCATCWICHQRKQDTSFSKSKRIQMRCRIPRIHSTIPSKKNEV